MLHAPTSEAKTEPTQSKSQLAPQAGQKLYPHSFDAAGAYALSSTRSVASVRSPQAQQRQTMIGMQSAYGNQAVLRMMQSSPKVARMPALRPSQGMMLQRKCACGGSSESVGECAECRTKREGVLQRREAKQGASPASNAVPPIVHNVLSSPGQPLDAGTRAFMEPRFGQDFSQVRVHTDARAAESARAVNALAYTVGRSVVFGAGQYAPGTSEGRRLMAHELTHVVQQEGNSQMMTASLAIGAVCDTFEQEAETTAERVMSRSFVTAAPATTSRNVSEITLRRLPKQPPTCPPNLLDEPEHQGTCPDIVRESGELERFAALGPSVETLALEECYLIKNLKSESSDFSKLKEWDGIAKLLAALLKVDSSVYLSIFGYSDCIGAAPLNDALRWKRALEVQDYFVRRLNVDPERIDFKAAEATKYVDTNATPEGRTRNRSIGILVMHAYVNPNEKPYTVPGLGKRKKDILDNGGTVLDMAIAMLETEHMDAIPSSEYPLGDGKTGDAANYGIFKQNWLMIQTVTPEFKNRPYTEGEALNHNLHLDIDILHKSQDHYGMNYWFAGHRNGPTGLTYPMTHDIATYRNTVYWIRDQLISHPEYQKDNTRVARTVVAI